MIAITAMLTGLKSFLSVNWKWVVLGAVALFLYWKVGSWYDAYQEQQQAERERITRLEVEKAAAEISAQSLVGTMTMMIEQQRKTEMLLLDALKRQDTIREEMKQQVDVFEDHDFPELVDAKPGLIEKLANKATNERMKELEDALND